MSLQGGFVLVWKGFCPRVLSGAFLGWMVLSGVVLSAPCVRIHPLQQKAKHHFQYFRFLMYDYFKSVTSHALGPPPQSALEMGPSHCLNRHLGQDLGFLRIWLCPKVARMEEHKIGSLTVSAKLGQTSSFPIGHF